MSNILEDHVISICLINRKSYDMGVSLAQKKDNIWFIS